MHYLSVGNFRKGNVEKSLELDRETVRLREKLLGKNHRDTFASQPIWQNSLARIGHVKESLALNKEILAAREKLLGPEDLDTARSMNNLALLYKRGKQFEKALALEQQGWEFGSKTR